MHALHISMVIGLFLLSGWHTPVAATPMVDGCKSRMGALCALDFTLPDLKQKPVRLSDFKGKVVVLHFWATWCKPCEEEMKLITAMASHLQTSNVQIVTVSLDASASEVVRYFGGKLPSQTSPRITMLLDATQRVSAAYGSNKVPESFIIRPDGTIADSIIGSHDWGSITLHYLQCLGGD